MSNQRHTQVSSCARRTVASAMAVVAALAIHASAQTWDGDGVTGGDVNWSNAANWNPDGVPANDGTADLVMAGTIDTSNTVDFSIDINGLTFDNTAGAFVISNSGGSFLTVRGGGITNNDAQSQTLLLPVMLAANQTWSATSGAIVVNDAINLGIHQLSVNAVAGTSALAGNIAGTAGSIVKNGAGTLSLNETNSYAGATVVNDGTLFLAKTNAVPAALTIGNGSGTGVVSLGVNQGIADTTAVAILNGTFNMAGFSETIAGLAMTGGSVISGNILSVNGNVTSGAHASQAGVVVNALDLLGATRSFTIADGSSAVDMEVQAPITSGGITKWGPGALRLTGGGPNTFSAPVIVNEGTLLLSKNAGVSAINQPLTIGDGVGGAGADIVRLLNSQQISSGVTVSISESGVLDLNSDQHLSDLKITGGQVVGVGSLQVPGGLSTLASSSSAVISSIVNPQSQSPTFDVADGAAAEDLVVSGTIEHGTYTKIGLGTMKLSGSTANSQSSAQVASGTLLLEKQAGVNAVGGTQVIIGDGAGPMQGDVVRYGANDNQIPDTLNVIVQSTGLLDLNGRSDTIGTLTMSGPGVVETGSGVLTVANQVTTSLNPGAAGTINGNLNLNGSRTFNVLDSAPSVDLVLGANLSNGTLVKQGAGALLLSGNALVSPASYRLDAGTLSANGLTVGSGRAFTHNGGTFTGTLNNQGTFMYNAGTFAGQMINKLTGVTTFNADFTAIGGLSNEGTFTIAAARTVTFVGGPGVTNNRTINLQGGTLAASGTLTFLNNDLISGFGELEAQSVNFANAGAINVTGGDLTIDSNFSPLNLGTITVPTGLRLQLPGPGNMQNTGLIILSGGKISGVAGISNDIGGEIRGTSSGAAVQTPLTNAGGVVRATAGVTLTMTSLTGNTAGGELRVDDGATMNVLSSFATSGTIVLTGANATLSGGTITNTGTLRGAGRVNNVVSNSGFLRADGTLTLAAAGQTNAAAGRIQSPAGTEVFYSQGLATNSGQILLTGGAFDNNNLSLSNPGEIKGYGTLRAGGVTNNGAITFTAGSSDVFGVVTNNNDIVVTGGGTATFYDSVNNASGGNIAVTANSAVIFLNAVTGGGTFSGSGTKYFVNGSSSLPELSTIVGDTVVESFATLSATRIREDSLTVHGKAVIPEVSPSVYDPGNNLYPIGNNATGSNVKSLEVYGAGQLDLGNSDLVIDHAGSSPLDDVRNLLASGFNGGGWDGPGIISSGSLNTDPSVFALGYCENADLPIPYGTELGGPDFFGQDADATALLIKFTWLGDLNLDGFVDFQDLSVFNTNYDNGASSGRYWFEGDFNYDGFIDFQDLSLFNTNYDPSKPSLPEPGVLGAMSAFSLSLRRRYRRSR